MIELLIAGASLTHQTTEASVTAGTQGPDRNQSSRTERALPASAALSTPVFVTGKTQASGNPANRPAPPASEPSNRPVNVPARGNLPAGMQAVPARQAPQGAAARQVPQSAARPAAAPVRPVAASTRSAASTAPALLAFKGPALFKPAPPRPRWLDAARGLLGVRYRLGGTSWQGIDCSGFTQKVMASVGVRLPRTSRQQARVGTPVASKSLAAGDLVFFDTAGRGNVTHVGLYIGSDQFINANSYAGRVKVDRLMRDPYWKRRYLGGRRVMTQFQASVSGPQINAASVR